MRIALQVILVDTNVWVAHLRDGDALLAELLRAQQAATHPAVIGELALGRLHDRSILADLDHLPQVTVATGAEVRRLIESAPLHGAGVGWVDAHLLASARLTPGVRLWTLDRRLAAVAARLGVEYASA